MLFNSFSFILLFLPVSVAGFYALAGVNHRWAAAWLVAASLVFYSWWQSALLILLCGSILGNFLCGYLILRAPESPRLQTSLMTAGIGANLLLLCYFKYLFPTINWLGTHGLLTLSHPYTLLLPLGISFFTFTQIGYLIDCKGGVVKSTNFLDYALFVTFFPHLIAGPILHHREMMPQFANPETYRFRWDNLSVGLTLFIIGLFKKVVVADSFINSVDFTFGQPYGLTAIMAWQGVLCYSLELYFDFSGYSDMAIGLGRMFGIRFPANFDSPYKTTNIIDFWQRWHMTLTRYLTLYLYTPIGLWVARQRAARGKSMSRQAAASFDGFVTIIALPIFFVMALAGVWHGAGLQFLIFGLLHAVYLTINHAYRIFGTRIEARINPPGIKWIGLVWKVGLTYLGVVIAQVFFRATSVPDALQILKGMGGAYGFSPGNMPRFDAHGFDPGALRATLSLIPAYFVVWTMPNSLQLMAGFEPSLTKPRPESFFRLSWQPTWAWALTAGAAAAVAFLSTTGLTEFIYFRF